jgi:DNA modification methylase
MNPNQQIEMRKVETLIPYARNARTHSDQQVAQIAASIKEFGFNNPILIRDDLTVIAGHGRLAAATKLGLTEVPTICLSHLTPTQVKAYIIADNKLAINAGWDEEMLALEVQELELEGFDVSLAGFDTDDVSKLLAQSTPNGLTDEDDVPEVPEEPKTKLGDVWLLGNHRVMCGDSTSTDELCKLMNGSYAEICFTSPPYNAGSLNIKGQNGTKEKYNSFNDNQTEDEYFDFLCKNINAISIYSNETFYNIGLVENNKRVIIKLINHYVKQFKDIIYWNKKSVAPHIQPGIINNKVEFIICFGQNNKRKFDNPQFGQGTYFNVIEGNNASQNEFSKIHKAVFPLYLPENIVNNFCSKGKIVLDTFGGTGTTLIACEKNGRINRSMELDPRYVDVIVKRWQDFTGKVATLESNGSAFPIPPKQTK